MYPPRGLAKVHRRLGTEGTKGEATLYSVFAYIVETQQATVLQTRIGAALDIAQASVLVAKLGVDRGMVEFLRGVAIGAHGPQASAG